MFDRILFHSNTTDCFDFVKSIRSMGINEFV